MFIFTGMTMQSPLPNIADTTDPRADEILERVREAFVIKGFDGSSMQWLAKAAGMSAGNFYRYFPSKAAIIAALIARDMQDVHQDFAALNSAPDPLAGLRDLLAHRISDHFHGTDARLWAEIEAVAARDSEIGQIGKAMQTGIHDQIIRIFSLISGLSEAEAQLRLAAHADALMVLVKGASIRGCQSHGVAGDGLAGPAEFQRVIMRLIETLLAEVVATSSDNERSRKQSL